LDDGDALGPVVIERLLIWLMCNHDFNCRNDPRIRIEEHQIWSEGANLAFKFNGCRLLQNVARVVVVTLGAFPRER
jgi:hypothetical protein